MIYVTVSGCSRPFIRLLEKMDEIAGEIDENVIMQSGTDFISNNAYAQKYLPRDEANKLIRKARLIVAHAGIGVIICALKFGTPIVIFPRLKKFNEHFDDHQLDICKILENRQGIRVVYELQHLKDAISFSGRPVRERKGKQNIIKEIRHYLSSV